MVDYLEILRLKHLGYSQRQIMSSVSCSNHTIKAVWDAAQELNLQWPMPENTTNEELKTILFPNKNKPVQLFFEPDYAYIHGELARSGVTLTLLWEEYRQKCYMEGKTPYQYTQFAVKYNKWARSTKATMRIQHKPGDSIEVDWAGDTIPYYDPISGEAHPAYLFVAVLPCSLYVYATVCSDMQLGNWLNCHINAFKYFGGVARLLIPDNCKTATTQNSKFDVVLNRSYQELAAHYGTAIVPARVRKPKDKSHAEAAVWSVAKIPNDYVITDGLNKYSVAYVLIGEKVDIKITRNIVEVFYKGYKSCASLNKLATLYSEERLEKACQRLLLYSSSPTVRNINSILKNGQDKVSTHTQESVETAQSNDYGLTRGANYCRRRSEQQ